MRTVTLMALAATALAQGDIAPSGDQPCACPMVYCPDPLETQLIPGTEGNCCGGSYQCVSKCPPMVCSLYCEGGYQEDDNGCTQCACADTAAPAPKTEALESYNCFTRESWSAEKRAWCCANKKMGCPQDRERPTPVACCKAMTAECLACTRGESQEAFCGKDENKAVSGCDRFLADKCSIGAGYVLCPKTGECVRPWEDLSMDEDGDGSVDVDEFEAACHKPEEQQLLGGKQDENGCYTSAGYRWCDARNECIRPFDYTSAIDADKSGRISVEEFEAYCGASPVGMKKDEHGCVPTAGYHWCEADKQCLRSWEQKDRMDADGDGKVSQEEFTSFCKLGYAKRSGGPAAHTSPKLGAPVEGQRCLASAGYVWCQSRQECVRTFDADTKALLDTDKNGEVSMEEFRALCGSPNVPGASTSPHDCVSSAGYTWCTRTSQCVRSFEMKEEMDSDKDGVVSEEEFVKFCQPRDERPMLGAGGAQCLASAGYLWCESKGECVRPFEHKQELDFDKDGVVSEEEFRTVCGTAIVGGPEDKCLGSAGYEWCASRGECLRSWENTDKIDSDMDGQISDQEWHDFCDGHPAILGARRESEPCLSSAGYTFCAAKGECVRPFEMKAEADSDKDGTVSKEEFAAFCNRDKCLASAGYQWCESRNDCVRWFEHKDEMDADKDGSVTEDEFVGFCNGMAAAAYAQAAAASAQKAADAPLPAAAVPEEGSFPVWIVVVSIFAVFLLGGAGYWAYNRQAQKQVPTSASGEEAQVLKVQVLKAPRRDSAAFTDLDALNTGEDDEVHV